MDINLQVTTHSQSFHLAKALASLPSQQEQHPCHHKVGAARNKHGCQKSELKPLKKLLILDSANQHNLFMRK